MNYGVKFPIRSCLSLLSLFKCAPHLQLALAAAAFEGNRTYKWERSRRQPVMFSHPPSFHLPGLISLPESALHFQALQEKLRNSNLDPREVAIAMEGQVGSSPSLLSLH